MRRASGVVMSLVSLVSLVLCSGAAQAAPPPLSFPPFDRAHFQTAEAQGLWAPVYLSDPVSAVPFGPNNETVLSIPCDRSRHELRCYYDYVFPAPVDLSSYNEFVVDVYVPDPGVVSGITVYFAKTRWSENFDYTNATTFGWQTLHYPMPKFTQHGDGATWRSISAFRFSAWTGPRSAIGAGSAEPLDLLVRSFRAIPRSPVAVIRDTAPEGVSYAGTHATLADASVATDVLYPKDLERGYLDSTEVVVLPDTPILSDAALTVLENFVARGGRLVAHGQVDARLQALLGVRVGAPATSNASFFNFSDSALPELPIRVNQERSVAPQITLADPARQDTRLIATWNTGLPAWFASNAGYYLSSTFQRSYAYTSNAVAQRRMFLALLEGIAPGVTQNASEAALAAFGNVGSYDDAYPAVKAHLLARAREVSDERAASLDAVLQTADVLYDAAIQSNAAGGSINAVELVCEARPFLREAYALAQPAGSETEFRAVWNHDGAGSPPGTWPATLASLVANGFNTIIPNVSGAGFVRYTSSGPIPPAENLRQYGDLLAQAIDAAHAAGVKVHAWDVTWNLFGNDHLGPGASWLTYLRDSDRLSKAFDESGALVTLDGRFGWMSPCVQENRDLKMMQLLEIAENYEVDGIHLDYIRSNNSAALYELACKTRFEAETGVTVPNWPADVRSGALMAAYDAWRPTVITSFVEELHDALTAVNLNKQRRGQPAVLLSASVGRNPVNQRNGFAQDWAEWVNRRAVDFLCPMNYTANLAEFEMAMLNQNDVIANRIPFYPGMGTGGYEVGDVSTDMMIAETVATRGANALGVSTGGFVHYNLNATYMRDFLPLFGSGATSNRSARASNLLLGTAIGGEPILGKPFKITLSVSNAGPDAASATSVAAWLPAGLSARSVTTSQGSCALGAPLVCSLGILANGATASVVLDVTASTTGALVLAASVRSESTDPESVKNAASATVNILAPDLTPAKVSAQTKSSSKITISDVIANHGKARSDASIARYYLSTTKKFDATTAIALEGCARAIPGLVAGAASTQQTTCTRPAAARARVSYYLLVVADAGNAVAESDEANNIGATASAGLRW